VSGTEGSFREGELRPQVPGKKGGPKSHDPYVMRISRTTVDKLGIKLYDKVAAVVAELVANSYDADATHVSVSVPLDRWLAVRKGKKLVDQGLSITVEDDGNGMEPKEAIRDYLVVGKDRRKKGAQGNRSRRFHRLVMGHKGIGKLAPFGICKRIEVRSSGSAGGMGPFTVSHFVMNYARINQDTDEDYHPDTGAEDGAPATARGTKVVLSDFLQRRTPDKETFHRQLAARFGVAGTDFEIKVNDVTSGESFVIGELEVDVLPETRLKVVHGKLLADDGADLGVPLATEDGKILETNGWVAMARHAYKNPELAGVRIYARGKIVATTRDFEVQSGFTGEHTIRSYLVGKLQADWLDEDEDLIRTDRQDILWASEQGQALQAWGVRVIKTLGDRASGPRREMARRVFLERSDIEELARKRFGDREVQESAVKLARAIGSTVSLDDLDSPDYVKGLSEIVLAVAPHKMLLDELEEAGKENGSTIAAIAALLGNARVAEAASLGQIARERLHAIDQLAEKTKGGVAERDVQDVLERAPWLIEPRWTVLSADKPISEVWEALRAWWKKEHPREAFPQPVDTAGSKRPDFILVSVGYTLVVVEIKKPGHDFDADDFERLHNYVEALDDFLDSNKSFQEGMSTKPIICLIADGVNLKGPLRTAYMALVDQGRISQRTWQDFLKETRMAHADFLKARSKLTRPTAPD
jgi:hypothetical protein